MVGLVVAGYIGYEVWLMVSASLRKSESQSVAKGGSAAYERSKFDTAPLSPDAIDRVPETYGRTQTVRRMIQYFEKESDKSQEE